MSSIGIYAPLAAPRWRLSTAQGACSICGWLTGWGEHYEHVEHREVHCAACHRVGHDYAVAGDSEGSPAALEVSRKAEGLVVRIAAAQRRMR
jgi:hypothetical protein